MALLFMPLIIAIYAAVSFFYHKAVGPIFLPWSRMNSSYAPEYTAGNRMRF